jgi:hypothetical protein
MHEVQAQHSRRADNRQDVQPSKAPCHVHAVSIPLCVPAPMSLPPCLLPPAEYTGKAAAPPPPYTASPPGWRAPVAQPPPPPPKE